MLLNYEPRRQIKATQYLAASPNRNALSLAIAPSKLYPFDGGLAVSSDGTMEDLVMLDNKDWLVLFADELIVYSDEDFQKMFEPAASALFDGMTA